MPAEIHLGTSAFTAAGWEGSFYPNGLSEREYLTFYATKFDTVEIDSTFYRAPLKRVVQGWANKTPEGFVFAAKVPQVITHEKVLVDCDAEFKDFVEAMDCLGEKLGRHKPVLVIMYGLSEKNYWNEIAGCALSSDGIQKHGNTILAVTPHPTSHGSTNFYWMALGERLRHLADDSEGICEY